MAIIKLGNDTSGASFSNISTYPYARFMGGTYSVVVEAGDTLTLIGIGEVRANTTGQTMDVAVYVDGTYERVALHEFTFTDTENYVRQTQSFNMDLTPWAGETLIIAQGGWGDLRALLLDADADYFRFGDGDAILADPYPNRTGFANNITASPVWAEIQRGASGPTLSTIPENAYPGQSRTITGTGFGATKGTGGVTIGGDAQTVTAWADTSITFTTVLGGNSFGTDRTLVLTTDADEIDSGTIDLIVEPGTGDFVDVVDPATTNEAAFAYQVEDAGGNPVVTGDQFQWRYTGLAGDVTAMTVQADTLPSSIDQEGDVEGRFWDATDSTWSEWYTFTAAVPVVDDIGPVISIGAINTTDTTPTASGSAGDSDSLTLDLDGVDVTHTSSYNITPLGGSWSQQFPELAIGTYTMTLTGVDTAGNETVETATLQIVEPSTSPSSKLLRQLLRGSLRSSLKLS